MPVLLTLGIVTTSAADFYVSTSGNDSTGNGSLANPWKTPAFARDHIGVYKTAPVTIWLLGGSYFFTNSLVIDGNHSGSAAAPVAYRAYNSQFVRFIGGVLVNTAAAAITTRSFFKTEAAPMIYEINLQNQGITNLVGLNTVQFNDDKDRFARSELFFNGAPCILARWPNNSFAEVAADGTTNKTKFTYSEAEPSLNAGTSGGYVLACFNKWLWYGCIEAISAINPSTKEITMSPAHPYSSFKGDSYYLFNLPGELDSPGEYYLDRTNRVLYFYPPLGTGLDSSELLVSTLSVPIVNLTNASNVEFAGIQFESGCNDGIAINTSTNCTVDYCTIKNMAVRGVHINGGYSNSVHHCAISGIGVTGVSVWNSGTTMTLTRAGHRVEYNDIQGTGRLAGQVGSMGIEMQTCVGIYVRHNSIHDTDTYGIKFQGLNGAADLFIEYNDIYKVCQYIDDAGPIYGGVNYHGNVYLNYNYIHDSGGWKGGGTSIYLDVHASNGQVFGNVVKDCDKLLSQNGGRNGTAENNIFINDKPSTVRWPIDLHTGTDDVQGYVMPYYLQYVLPGGINNPAYNRLPFTTGYIYNIPTDGPGVPKYNQAQNNVSVSANNYYFDANVVTYQRIITNNIRYKSIADVAFVDPANGNFALSPTSDVYTQLPGFQPIPFDQIGSGAPRWQPTVHERIVDRGTPARTTNDLALGATVVANTGSNAGTLTDGNPDNGFWSTTWANNVYAEVRFTKHVTLSQIEIGIQKDYYGGYLNNMRIEVFDDAKGVYQYWTGNHFAPLPPGIDSAGYSTQIQYTTALGHRFQKATFFQFDQYVTTSKIRVWVLDAQWPVPIQGMTQISAYRGEHLGNLALNKPVTVSGYAGRSVFDPYGLTDSTEWPFTAWDASLSAEGPPAKQLADFTVPLFKELYFDRFVVVAGLGKSAYLKSIRIEAKDANNASIWWNGSAWVPLPISDTAPYAQQIQYVTAVNDGSADYLDVQTTRLRSDQVRVRILDSYAEGIQLAEFCLFDTQDFLATTSVAEGNGQIALEWPPVNGATSYTVTRSLVSGSGYTQVGTVTGTTFTNTGLANGLTYYYQVVAMNGSTVLSQFAEVAGTPTSQSDGVWVSALSGNWNVASNWQGGTWASGVDTTATFNQLTGVTATQNISGLILGNLQFANGNYTIQGNSITLDTTSGTSIANVSNGTAIVSAPLTGDAALLKTGSGTLIHSKTNTYTGSTAISGGILVASNNNALSTGPVLLTTGATRLVLADGLRIPNNITLSASGSSSGVAGRGLIENSATGTATLTNGTITITASPGLGGLFASAGGTSGTLAVYDYITSSVPVTLRAGTAVFGGGGSYTNFGINQGTLLLGANNGLATNALLAGGASGVAVCDLRGYNQTLAGILQSAANLFMITNSSTTSDATLTINGGGFAYGTNIFGGKLVDGAKKLLLTLNGGKLTLTNANTYHGDTTISGGTLELAQPFATLATNSTLTFAGGATLKLTVGTVTNRVACLRTNGIAAAAGLYNTANSSGFITGAGYLQVGPSGPVRLTNTISGNLLRFSWPAGQGWRLQMQTNSLSTGLGTNWQYITDGTIGSTNITLESAVPAAFYRLSYP